MTKVLIVEDEAIVAADIADKLGKLGYEIAGTAMRGPEAIALADERRPDIVLMDIQLAGPMDGIEAAQRIRDAGMAVIYLTAHSDEATLARAKLTGPFGYILKPFDERDLQIQIEIDCARHKAECRLRESEEQLRQANIELARHIGELQAAHEKIAAAGRDMEEANAELRREMAERKQAEEALRESEERYRSLVELSPDAVLVHAEFKIVYLNYAALFLFGAKGPDEILGRPVLQFVHPDDREVMRERISESYNNKRIISLTEAKILRLDQEAVSVETTGAPIMYKGKSATQVVIRDITERRRAEEALRESQSTLQSFYDSSSYLMAVTGLDRGQIMIVHGNTALARFFSTSTDLMTGRSLRELSVPSEITRLWAEQYRRSQLEGVPALFEYEHETTSGKRWVSATVAFLHESKRGRPRFSLVAEDITERKEAEEALRESEQKFVKVFQGNAAAIALTRVSDKRIVDVNESYLKIFGFSREEVIGKVVSEVVRWKHPEQQIQAIQELERDGAFQNREYELKKKNGEVWTGLISSEVIQLRGEKFFLTSSLDITDRKLAEVALEQANTRIRDILESISDGFMALDREWRFTYVNNRAAKNVGATPEELIGSNIWQKFPSIIGTEHEKYYRQSMESRTIEHFEIRGVLTDCWYEISTYPSMDGITVYWLDITERKRAQEKVSLQNSVVEGMNRIFHSALTCDTEEELGLACLQVAEEVTRSQFGFIAEIGPDGLLHDIAMSNPGWELCTMYDKTAHRRPPGCFKLHGLYGRVLLDGKSFFTNEASSHPDSIGVPEGHPPLKAFLGSPLIDNGKTIGIIAMANPLHNRGYQLQNAESLERLATAVVQVFLRKRAEKALRGSEERLRTLSQATFEGIAISENGRVIEANEQFAEMHGFKLSEVLGKDITDFVPPEEREDRLQAMRSGDERINEYRAIKKDDSRFFIEVHGRTIKEGGRTLRVSVIRDVTERKLVEEALHKNEERLREYVKLLEYAPVMVRNMNDEIILWNSGMARMYGYTATEAIGRNCPDLLQTVFPQPPEQILEMLHGNGRWEGYLQHATGDGRKIIVASLWVLHKSAEGKATAIIEINNDITERRRAEEQLQKLNEELEARVRERTDDLAKTINTLQTEIAIRMEAEEEIRRLATAVESAADALVVTDAERGIIQYVNPAFEKITGYSREEAVGRDLHILESGKQGEEFFRELRETLKQDGVWTGRMVHKKKDGILYEEECTYSPVKNASGGIINYISIKRDVTEKVRLESIAQAVETMNNIGYIFAGVSHEIGNPINAMRITLDIMQRKLENLPKENIAEYLARVMEQVRKVEYLLKGLKNFNVHESVQPGLIGLPSFLDAFFSMIKKDFEAKGIIIEIVREPDARCVYADPRALQQVLLNVLTNSSDALEGREYPKIIIGISAGGGLVRIRVQDNGKGIEEGKVKDLFKPFYTTKEHGTGLGLVIIKKMMAKMNGTVEITSSINAGTTVELCLPSEKPETK